jgi:methyl coenzyme M reductase subunit C
MCIATSLATATKAYVVITFHVRTNTHLQVLDAGSGVPNYVCHNISCDLLPVAAAAEHQLAMHNRRL